MGKTRRKYSKEFKMEAIRVYENGERSTGGEVERELGDHAGGCWENGNGNWMSSRTRKMPFGDRGKRTEAEERIRQLERENALLKQDKRNPKKSAADILQGRQLKYRFIKREQRRYSVKQLCAVMGIRRSSYYAWKKRKVSKREQKNKEVMELIRIIYKRSRRTYGYPRVHAQLRKDGVECNKKRVARLMRAEGLQGQRKSHKVVTTDSKHDYPVAENLLNREFEVGNRMRSGWQISPISPRK